MRLIIFVALLFEVSFSLKLTSLAPKIINGRDAEENEFPYIVSIRRAELEILLEKPYHICGGSIINSDTVVTASHCLFDPFGNHLNQPGSYFVVAGFLGIWSDIDTAKRFSVVGIFKHPNYNGEIFRNDIAILKIAPDFTFDLPNIQPITIETNRNISEGSFQSCAVHGWGTVLPDYQLYPDILQTVDLKISNFNQCNETYGGVVDTITQVCAYESEKDSCSGDSGGPLVCNGKLLGIVSYGYECAQKGYPGVYTKVSAYLDFIENPKSYSTASSLKKWQATVSILISFGTIAIKS